MLRINERQLEVGFVNATIANGAALSGTVDLGGFHAVGIIMPAAWTAASITIQASLDQDSFFDLYDADGTEVALTVAASRWIRLDPSMFAGFGALKLRSGPAGGPVNQAAERAVTVVMRSL